MQRHFVFSKLALCKFVESTFRWPMGWNIEHWEGKRPRRSFFGGENALIGFVWVSAATWRKQTYMGWDECEVWLWWRRGKGVRCRFRPRFGWWWYAMNDERNWSWFCTIVGDSTFAAPSALVPFLIEGRREWRWSQTLCRCFEIRSLPSEAR